MSKETITSMVNVLKTSVGLIKDQIEKFQNSIKAFAEINRSQVITEHKRFMILDNKINEIMKKTLKPEDFLEINENYLKELNDILALVQKDNSEVMNFARESILINEKINQKFLDIEFILDNIDL